MPTPVSILQQAVYKIFFPAFRYNSRLLFRKLADSVVFPVGTRDFLGLIPIAGRISDGKRIDHRHMDDSRDRSKVVNIIASMIGN